VCHPPPTPDARLKSLLARTAEQCPYGVHVEAAVSQPITGTRPATAETWAQTEPHQRSPFWRAEHRIHQFEQAILAQAQGLVQLLAEEA
jgi:hypothetical protein